jgi:hypothetical protein
MKTETPITNAISASILEQLEACKSGDDYKTAVKDMASRLIKLCKTLEQDSHIYREWIAREIQQMPDMGGGKPFAWEKLDESDKDNWRMRADEAAHRLASNDKSSDLSELRP